MLSNTASINTLDPRSMASLKRLAKDNSDDALRAASKQIEAMFLQMMLKAMRKAALGEGPFESEQTKFIQELQDQQLASDLAQSRGVGLADALFRQLGGGRHKETAPAQENQNKAEPQSHSQAAISSAKIKKVNMAYLSPRLTPEPDAATVSATDASPKTAAAHTVPQHIRNFVADIWPYAYEASKATGIPANFLVAQAALETGWGAKQPKNADGTPSYNLFNIKAHAGWNGRTTAQHDVVEFSGKSWQPHKAAFRSYASYAEAFADYAKFLSSSPRYSGVLGQSDASAFAQGLQRAGYATDPSYADKLVRIIEGNTLKSALN
ncbi:MAG: flagellar assembly peptidoglycan hydrolase FlgJ [Azoarcus sp.]|jgi:flagellar protein FlgJ|nr:flagellar assembly peptidoglycan hydrolase FlgJ [Azoarcus sp.]